MDPSSGKRIIVFASGAGSNARKIIEHFKGTAIAKVVLIVCNNPYASVLDIAADENIPVLGVEKNKFMADGYVNELRAYRPDLLVLAGFLWKLPPVLVAAFPRIINIHPALLPKYGGKNMYGKRVHQAVLEAGDTESGITIHYVDELYDHGSIIYQARCCVEEGDTAETLAGRVHLLEHEWYPRIIEQVLNATQPGSSSGGSGAGS